MTVSRISDEQVTDLVIRAYLYRHIIRALSRGEVDTQAYEIKHDEKYRPDLVSYRVYGTTEARWLVKLLCGIEDEETALPIGTVVRFPPVGFVRERIRHFADGGGL